MKITFFGAAHSVTGSCHCLEVNGKKILVDCGLQQGRDEHDNNALDFSPGYIDYVLVTHAHIDHIHAAGKVAKALNIAKAELAPGDHGMYRSKANAIAPYFDHPGDLPEVTAFEPITNCTVIALPGHTPGGSGFLFDDGKEKFLIAGDTIFYGSIGRTDLPGGDYATLINSITENLLSLPDDLTVWPGHGEETTIGFEKKHNPYLN